MDICGCTVVVVVMATSEDEEDVTVISVAVEAGTEVVSNVAAVASVIGDCSLVTVARVTPSCWVAPAIRVVASEVICSVAFVVRVTGLDESCSATVVTASGIAAVDLVTAVVTETDAISSSSRSFSRSLLEFSDAVSRTTC